MLHVGVLPACLPHQRPSLATCQLSSPWPPPNIPHPQGNHIFTSGATGTNAAVIRGALRAEKPELLTVVLPQSMSKQPAESQELLQQVGGWCKGKGCCTGVQVGAWDCSAMPC